MILSDLTGDDESDPVYRRLQVSNFARQQDFLSAIVVAAIAADRRYLSQNVIKALSRQLLARDRAEHLAVLQQVDASLATGIVDVTPLQNLLQRLLAEQFATVGIQGDHSAAAP